MAVRLREADSMAAMAELRQKIAELEIQVCVSKCKVCRCWCPYGWFNNTVTIKRLWAQNVFSRKRKVWSRASWTTQTPDSISTSSGTRSLNSRTRLDTQTKETCATCGILKKPNALTKTNDTMVMILGICAWQHRKRATSHIPLRHPK